VLGGLTFYAPLLPHQIEPQHFDHPNRTGYGWRTRTLTSGGTSSAACFETQWVKWGWRNDSNEGEGMRPIITKLSFWSGCNASKRPSYRGGTARSLKNVSGSVDTNVENRATGSCARGLVSGRRCDAGTTKLVASTRECRVDFTFIVNSDIYDVMLFPR